MLILVSSLTLYRKQLITNHLVDKMLRQTNEASLYTLHWKKDLLCKYFAITKFVHNVCWPDANLQTNLVSKVMLISWNIWNPNLPTFLANRFVSKPLKLKTNVEQIYTPPKITHNLIKFIRKLIKKI